jgi:nitrilase
MVKVAAVQAAPVWLDAQKTVDKTVKIIGEASAQGVKLVAFGEVWLPGYPFTIWLQPPMVAMEIVAKHRMNAVTLDGPELATICKAAKAHNIWVMMGFAERDRGSIYCSQALIDDRGEIVMSRRKLRPTHMERTVWGEGPATDLKVTDTPFGKVGGLCCWENIQPVNRQGMFQLGEQVHVAAWPSFGMFKGMRQAYALSAEANMAESQSYAMEGGCFVIAPNSVISEDSLEAITMGNEGLRQIVFAGGGSAAVFGPDGYRLTAPIPDTEEGLAIAEIDLAMIEGAKVFADPAGHYFRPDVARIVLEMQAGPAAPVPKRELREEEQV